MLWAYAPLGAFYLYAQHLAAPDTQDIGRALLSKWAVILSEHPFVRVPSSRALVLPSLAALLQVQPGENIGLNLSF